MTSVVVAVRVRPFNSREVKNKALCCIEMKEDMTAITDPHTGATKKFFFDYSYWSHDSFMEDEETGMFVKDSLESPYASQV
jgi:kinesin family protein 1